MGLLVVRRLSRFHMKCVITLLIALSTLALSGCVILPGPKERRSAHPDGFRNASHFVRVAAWQDRFHVTLSALSRQLPNVRLISGTYRSSDGGTGSLRMANASFAPNVGVFSFDLLLPGARADYSLSPTLLPFRGTHSVDFSYNLNGISHQVRESMSHHRPVQLVPLIPIFPDWGMNE